MLVEAHALGFSYDDVPVLGDVSFDINAGSSLAITGPSGSGKSTLLSVIGGLHAPTRGTLDAPGADQIGWVFQRTQALLRRTVRDNVSLPLLARGWKRHPSEQAADIALATVGLDDLAARSAGSLSGGQLQRLAIARCLVSRPRLVLADEPTANLDRGNADLVSETLVAAAGAHDSALIIATHDGAVASRCNSTLALGLPASGPPNT